ncbi:glycosyltransferase family 4 protein [Microbacterium sp. S1037]|uniref:glycosyltransferase family 4 protein n=1 Tax=Microbacterium sp. S1037 TaxID=3398227 RepID=UPI003AABA1C3
MAHIVLDARGYFTTTGRYIRKLVEWLARCPDDDNHYTLVLPADRLAEWVPPSPRFHAVGSDAPFFSWAEQTDLARLIRSLKPDVVHFCMQQQPVLLGAPRITTFHDLTLLKIHNRKKPLFVSLLRRAVGAVAFAVVAHRGRANVVVSRYSGRDLRRFTGVPERKIVLTYPAADPISEAAVVVTVPFSRFVLFVGNQVPYKNLERLAVAVEELRRTHPDVGLVVAGRIDDDGRLLRERRPDLMNRVHFAGYVSDAQLRWLYENASVYAFPSFFEGFGLPGLETMRHGCPVASSSATCLPEVYGDAARYFPPGDVQRMARALAEVLDDPELREELVRRGRRKADEYSWERMAAQTLATYRRAIDR